MLFYLGEKKIKYLAGTSQGRHAEMVNRYMKKCSIIIWSQENENQSNIGHHLGPDEKGPYIKKARNNNYWQGDVEK